MPDQPTFVVNDRRKFTLDGELRPEANVSREPAATTPEPAAADAENERRGPQLVSMPPTPASEAPASDFDDPTTPEIDPTEEAEALLGAGAEDASAAGKPSAEQIAEATRAYEATVDRLDTAMRASNPGGERMPEMTFERLVQSLYTQALLLLGGATEPGETPRVDILGARQTIDMLAVIAAKSGNNLTASEEALIESALFDLRMGFLEITQALARQARSQQPLGGGPGVPTGPRIVR